MSLSNEQVVSSLIAFYKSKGADLTYLLGDPVFQGLPLTDRIEAVKTHAADILAHSSKHLSPSESAQIKANTLINAITGGSLAAAGTHALLKTLGHTGPINLPGLAAVAGVGLAAGAITGGVTGMMRADTLRKSRLALRDQIGATSKDPSDTNAVGVLSVGSIQGRDSTFRNAIVNRIAQSIDDRLTPYIEQQVVPIYSSFHP